MDFKIAFDAGHGHNTPGKRSPYGEREWSFNNEVALAFEEEISKYKNIKLLRTDDKTGKTDIPLATRVNKANNWKANIYISFHHNAFKGVWGNHTGTETYYYRGSTEGKKLAELIHSAVLKAYELRDRGLKTNSLYITRETKMPAVLLEGGFMDSNIDIKKLRDSRVLKNAGIEIAKAVAEYANLKKKENALYKVQVGAFSIRENAENLLEQLKEDGYNGFITTENTQLDSNSKKEESIEVVNKLEYKEAIYKGKIGENVKELQRVLKDLGYYYDVIDGSAGNNTVNAIKQFQRDYNLVVDGSAGRATYNMINEILKNGEKTKPQNTSKKSKYYKIGDAHIIETTPDNIEISILANNLHSAKRFGINGTFYDTNTAPVRSPESCVFIAMNDGKALSNNAQFNGWNAPPRATMIYHTNGKIGFRQLKNINSIKDSTIWAIGGYMIKPYMDFKNEKIPGSVNYKTAHTYIGSKGDKIFLIVKPNHMISDIVPLVNQLGLEKCLVVDGGGSSQMNHPDGQYRSTRIINSAVLLKEV